MLDVRRLRVLSEVAAQGSFSAAGHALTLTQSAVSQHIAALEREVGQALVERGTRPLRPGGPARRISVARPRDAYRGPAVAAMVEALEHAAPP